MEKYRKWTDQATGVNPFIVANTSVMPLAGKFLFILSKIVKGSILMWFMPVLILFYCIPVNFLRRKLLGILLFLFGVYQIEDLSFEKSTKNSKINIILSNHSCFLDPLYYLYKYPSCQFLVFHQNQEGKTSYSLINPISMIISLFTNLQIFYKAKSQTAISSLQDLYKQNSSIRFGNKLIVFYEKIRTNGRGTIKVDKNLAQQLYKLEKDLVVTQIKYSVKRTDLFSLHNNGISNILAALGTSSPGNNMKIKASKQDCKELHSANQLKESIHLMSLGPLLQTKASNFNEFYEFYQKTKDQNYKL